MVTYELNLQTIYFDGRLKENLDKYIIPELKSRDRDMVFCVTGRERDGKSTFAQVLGGYIASQLGTEFNTSNICMTPNELRKKIQNSRKNEVIIYDEAHRGMGSARALSEINSILRDLFMEMGQLNLCVIIVLPSFFLLDKYIALWRTRGLFHVYTKRNRRGFWVYFKEKEKKWLYLKGKKFLDMTCIKWPHFRGRFTKKTPIDEEEYKEKKRKSFKERARITRAEKYMYQRDALIMILREIYKMPQKKIIEALKSYNVIMTRENLSIITAKMREIEVNK